MEGHNRDSTAEEARLADKPASTGADWILKAMVAVAASDGKIDPLEIGLIQQVYRDQPGRSLTEEEIERAAEGAAKGNTLAEIAAAAKALDKATKVEQIRKAYLVLLTVDHS